MMADSKTLFRSLTDQLDASFDRDEAEAIVYRLLESRLHLVRNDIWLGKETVASLEDFSEEIQRINKQEPIQYILNEEEFFGRSFYVDASVLIPRPETEELVRYCLDKLIDRSASPKILDIGTGSGCIPVTLALEAKQAEVYATDISDAALRVANQNALSWNAKVTFLKHDILTEELPYNDIDLFISNPPYISDKEKNTMLKNVLAYEPHLALFTGSSDVLIFYKAIMKQSISKLRRGGHAAVEINEHFGQETAALFTDDFFDEVKLIKDINQKNRFVVARRR